MLGTVDEKGVALSGLTLTIAAFEKFVGPVGRYIVSIGIVLFAYSTILGWEYQGEKCFEYLFGSAKFNVVYRVVFCLITYIGATQALELVWNLADIFNALMAIPNLISLLILADIIKEETERYQPILEAEKAGVGVQAATKDEVEQLRDMTVAMEEKIEKTQKRLDNLEKKMNKVEATVNKMRK
jgi:AGCS family alanine or glycine:cation symporter